MKKVLKVIGIVVVVIFLLLLILPFAFKGKIIALVKEQANKNINAKVEFSDVNLSLIRHFPNLSVGIEDLSIVGVKPFEGDTLAAIKDLNLTLNIMSVIKGDAIEIEKIGIIEPVIHILVSEDGSANYDIAIESPEDSSATADSGESMKLSIEEYQIEDGIFVYHDQTLPMLLKLRGLNHSGSGDFAKDIFTLSTQTHIEEAVVDYDGVRYVDKAAADLMADIAINLNEMKFTFEENELNINQLSLAFDGWLAMPKEDIDMDITFDAKKNDLKTLLSLIPAQFTKDLDGVKASGTIALSGFVKGTYNDDTMPGFGLNLGIENGSVKYPDLPKSIENIQVKAEIKSPQGSNMDAMTVNVPEFHLEIGKSAAYPNTVDARLSLRHPVTDPYIDTKVDADLNLSDFKDVIPLGEEFSLEGFLTAHFELKGAMSAIENQNFDSFDAKGVATLSDFQYDDQDVNVEIPEAELRFTPQKLALDRFRIIYDEMKMSLDGYINNYIAYALTDTTLRGVFNFKADKIDVNKLMGDSTETAAVENEDSEADVDSTASPSEIMLVPDNLDITLNVELGKVTYDDLVLNQVKGAVKVTNETASLENITFNLLGGSMAMSGAYNTQNHDVAIADFTYDINNITISDAAKAFSTVEKFAPIAKYATGEVSSELQLKTEVNGDFEPIYKTMNGRGSLSTHGVVLEGGSFLKKLSNTLSAPALAKQKVQDVHISFVIKDGKITTEPFDVKLNNMTATVSGWSSFEEKIDYLMKMKIPSDELGGSFSKMAQGLLSSANAFLGSSMSLGEFININVRIHGDIADPKISPSFAGMGGGSATDQAKEAVKEVINEKIDEGKEKLREEASKQAAEILEKAQKQADKLVNEARQAADKIRAEAAEQAQNLIDQAGNPLAKRGAEIAAKKIKEQADKQASKLETTAKTEADKIMAAAHKKANKLNEQ